MNGIRLPGIIVPQDFTVSKDQEPKPEEKSVDFSELDRLFQAGDFAGFLSCKTFTSTPFRELPEDVQQQALTCAARILYRAPTMEITMEPFERALFQAEEKRGFHQEMEDQGHVRPGDSPVLCPFLLGAVYPAGGFRPGCR